MMIIWGLTGTLLGAAVQPAALGEGTGRQFLGLEGLGGFDCSTNAGIVECVSQVITSRVPWKELILSWNVRFPFDGQVRLEARAVGPERASRYFILGLWSADPVRHPRESVPKQQDADGEVRTDTLVLKASAPQVQVRVVLGGGAGPADVVFLGISVADGRSSSIDLPPLPVAWGTTLDVPRRSQLDYPGGENEWCSPTSVSMILNYWAVQIGRKDLQVEVPAAVKGIHDPRWPGTGNWPFNTAFAGSFPGIRAYVTRMDQVEELERWVAAGTPLAASLSYNLLRGREEPGNGHLVVVVGFTETGDVVVNDPGTRLDNVRRTFPRANFARAWATSGNTVYVIHPANRPVPSDPLGHWHPGARADGR